MKKVFTQWEKSEALPVFRQALSVLKSPGLTPILKKSLRFLPPIDVAVEDALDLHALARWLVENQPAIEGRRQNEETHASQGPMFEARPRSHLRELRQPVEGFKSGIQKTPRRRLVIGGDEIARGDQVFIRLR